MRWCFLTLSCLLLATGPFAHADERIAEVLVRSQQILLDRQATAAAGTRLETVRTSFDTVARALELESAVDMRVIEGNTVAETLQGRVVMVNESLADLTEGERLFVIAHEFGHIALHHWAQTEQLYQKWVPGAVTPERTEPVAALLGRDAHELAYRQEFEADAFALRTLHALGFPLQDAIGAFMHMGHGGGDSATHPGAQKRIAALRAAEAP